MSYFFDNQTPIYLQIMDVIRTEIISGKYKAGQKLPSVRDFAMQFEANPNTVQKALFELEELGLIITERTSGKYVTSDDKILLNARLTKVEKIVGDFFSSMEKLGINKEEAKKLIGK